MGAEKGIWIEICLLLHHTKNFLISLMYVFAVELALELSKTLNKELRSGLRADGSNVQALLVITTCKKNYKYKYKVHNKGKGKKKNSSQTIQQINS